MPESIGHSVGSVWIGGHHLRILPKDKTLSAEGDRFMTGIIVTYEEWLDGDPGWLRVIIERQSTGEVLSAFTQPATRAEVRKLKEDLEAGRPSQSDLEFINYYRPGSKHNEEINDDLNVVTITGSIVQTAGSPQLTFSITDHSLRDLVVQVLKDRSPIDMQVLTILGEIAPASLDRCAESIETAPPPLPPARGLGTLVMNKGQRAFYWGGQKLNINSLTHFDLLQALYEARGNIVSHQDLFLAIRPGAGKAPSLTATSEEVREALQDVRAALRQAGCPLRITARKRLGYLLPTS